MEFRILGPLEMIDNSGTPIPTTGHRQRSILAVLLVEAPRVVSLTDLIDAVWDSEPPATAKRQIQNTVSLLRRCLAQVAANASIIVADGPGYRIRLGPGELDAQVFAERTDRALRLVSLDRPAEAVAELRSALALWRGPALHGLGGRSIEAAASRLDEHRLDAVELCLDLELGLGRHRRLVGELIALVAAHPLRERLVGHLMLALHRSGRTAEALDVYQRLRGRLADQLGLDPGTSLRQVYTSILRNAPAPDDEPADPPTAPGQTRPTQTRPTQTWPPWTEPTRTEPAETEPAAAVPDAAVPAAVVPGAVTPAAVALVETVPAQLPPDVSGFAGRADQLKHLDELLSDVGNDTAVVIATVVGTAGVGKTALAVHWGHRVRDRFPDGQLYVKLHGYHATARLSPIEALARLLAALGMPADQIPHDVESAAGLYRSMLSGRRMLVVLDDAGSADQVRPLFPASPGCLVLVTSRDRLSGLIASDSARPLALGVLAPDEARRLLVSILGAERVAAEPRAAVDLAELCSYLPLALRIAAATLVGRPAPAIAEYVATARRAGRLGSLEIEGDEASGVRSALDLSYQALQPPSRRLFRLLGTVAAVDVTPAAIAAAADIPTERAAAPLAQLVTAHLVDQYPGGRYGCHDLLREYAASLAGREDTDADRTAAALRLGRWYLRHADAAATVLYPQRLRLAVPAVETTVRSEFATAPAALEWLDAERANLVATIEHTAAHGPRSVAWLLADTLRGYFWLRLHTYDWARTARAALAAAEAEGDLLAQAATLLSLGDTDDRRNDRAGCARHYTRALALCERIGWQEGRTAALGKLGVGQLETGRLRQAAGSFEQALALCRGGGSGHSEAVLLGSLGRVHLQLGDLSRADEYLTRALLGYRACGARQGTAAALDCLGEVRYHQGRLDEARTCLAQALDLEREIGDRGTEAYTLRSLAIVHLDVGEYAPALELAHTVMSLAGELNDRRIEGDACNLLGAVYRGVGRRTDAAGLHGRALDLARQTSYRYTEVESLIGLASCGVDGAANLAEDALAIARQAGFRLLEEQALAVAGRLRPAASRSATAT